MIKSRLNNFLEFYNLSQKDLVDGTGINKNTISRYCNDTFEKIDKSHLDLLCSFFKCSLDDLFEVDYSIPVKYPSLVVKQSIINIPYPKSDIVTESHSPQKEMFSSDIEPKTHKIISGDDSLQVREENNIYVSDSEVFNYEIQQARLNLEYEIETNLTLILNNIIEDAENSIYHDEFKQEICNYFEMKELPLSFKFIHPITYRLIYNILHSQHNDELLSFFTRMRNIYANGGLLNLDDDTLANISYIVNEYIYNKNKPVELKIREDVKKSNKILERIDIYNEYKTNKKD